jgi:hypothetical protein
MTLLSLVLGKKKIEEPKTIADFQREKLITFGKEQFQKIMDLGLVAPVSLA